MISKKIIVIDDEPDILYTIKEICTAGGWQPITAGTGKQGYQLVGLHKPDLVIVDYHMPGWDGITTVRKIREQDSVVSILVLTVDERQEIADRFMLAGATDFAIKPIKSPDLISRIKVNLEISEIQRKQITDQQEIYVDKGISSATLGIITGFLEKKDRAFTIEEITAGVSLAYQTVHRYMQYLTDEGRVEIIPQYGKIGRPKNRYKLLQHT